MKKSSFSMRFPILMLTICVMFGILSVSLPKAAAAGSEFTSRNDFSWGINGHNQTYKSYPIRHLDQQIKLAAELGVQIYRFNYNPKNGSDYEYMDMVVDLVQRYGMEMMLVMDDFGPSADVLRSRYETVAKRYNGKNGHGAIRYIQIYNEVDVWAMTTKDFADIGNRREGDGTQASHYSKMALENVLPKFKAGIAGVKAGNPQCKTVINISYKHTYLFDYLKENGVKWDITGLDWYKNMEDGNYDGILKRLTERYPQDIIICETNIWPFNAAMESDYENDTTFLPNAMRHVYKNFPRVKGMIFYELLDEPAYEMQLGRYEGESHFGFVKVNKTDFSIGAKKPIYHRIQKMLGGGPKNPAPPKGDSDISSQTPPTPKPPVVPEKPVSSPKPVISSTTSKVPNISSSAASTLSSVTDSTPSTKPDDTESINSQQSNTSSEQKQKSNSFPAWLIAIIIGGTAIIIASIILTIIILKRKKQF